MLPAPGLPRLGEVVELAFTLSHIQKASAHRSVMPRSEPYDMFEIVIDLRLLIDSERNVYWH